MMKDPDKHEPMEDKVRRALLNRAVICNLGNGTVNDGKGGCFAVPSREMFIGEIFKGELAGQRLTVARVEDKAAKRITFLAYATTPRGSIFLNPAQDIGELMWKDADRNQ